MKIVLAQLRKDFVSAQSLCWIWIACVAFDGLFSLSKLVLPQNGLHGGTVAVLIVSVFSLVAGALVTTILQFLILVALTVRIIHADPLIEPDAFWRTRPVSRRELLLEKSIFVGVLLAGTVLSAWALNLRTQFGTAETSLEGLAVFVFGLVAYATLSADWSKLILNFIGISLLMKLAAGVILLCVRAYTTGQYVNQGVPAHMFNLVAQRELCAFHLGVFGAVIVWQYLTSRVQVARGFLAAAVLLAALWQGA